MNQSDQRTDMGAPINLTGQKLATNEVHLHNLCTSCHHWSFFEGDDILFIVARWLLVISSVSVLFFIFSFKVLCRPAAPSMQSPSCSKRPRCLEPPRAMAGRQLCRSFGNHAHHPPVWQSCDTLWHYGISMSNIKPSEKCNVQVCGSFGFNVSKTEPLVRFHM